MLFEEHLGCGRKGDVSTQWPQPLLKDFISELTVLLQLGHFKGQHGLQPKRQTQGMINHCRQCLPCFYPQYLVLLIYSATVILICNKTSGFLRKYIFLKMHLTTLMHGMCSSTLSVYRMYLNTVWSDLIGALR